MTLSLYSALFIFATIMVITPGPANLLLMSSGAQHGFYKSVPFVIGVTCGKLFLTIGLGIGFLTILNSNPILVNIIKVIGTAYICWLSWKILFLNFHDITALVPASFDIPYLMTALCPIREFLSYATTFSSYYFHLRNILLISSVNKISKLLISFFECEAVKIKFSHTFPPLPLITINLQYQTLLKLLRS